MGRTTMTHQYDHAFRQLDALMHDCAQAVHDDAEFNVQGNGVNADGAKAVLDNVAAIFEVRSVESYLDEMYTNDAADESDTTDTTYPSPT